MERAIHGPWGRWLPICYALFSGVLGTQSVLYGKALSMLLRTTISGDSQLDFWYTYLSLGLFILFASFWLRRYSKVGGVGLEASCQPQAVPGWSRPSCAFVLVVAGGVCARGGVVCGGCEACAGALLQPRLGYTPAQPLKLPTGAGCALAPGAAVSSLTAPPAS